MEIKTSNEKTFMSISKFAENIGVSQQTIREWDKNGKLKPHHRTVGGRRIYSQKQVDDFFK